MNKLTKLIFIIIFPISIFAQDFAEIDFLNSSQGLLIFADKVSKKSTLYLTTNGGDSWDSILEGRSLKSIYQFNSDKIFVGYETKGIAYTTDGGSSWEYEDFGKEEASVRKIDFANSNYGWVCTNRAVYITTDGGTTWAETGLEIGWTDALSIHLAAEDKGWLLKEDGEVYKYNKNSAPHYWEYLGDLGGVCYGPNAGITFLDSLNGYAVGLKKSYKTIDGGKTWSVLPKVINLDINDFYFFNKDNFFLSGERGIYFSDDGGENIIKSFDNGIGVLSIDFVSSSTGWAVNKGKIILKTTDGGQTWAGDTVTSASAPSIISVSDRPDDNGGFVIIKFERSNLDGLINSERLLSYEIYSVEKNWLNYKTNVVPNQQLFYEIEIRTQKDSIAENKNEQFFQVVAVTSSNRYKSNVMSGYSVDNLPPESPLILEGTYVNGEVKLLWRKSNSEDFLKYEIFRSENELFQIDSLDVYAELTDTIFIDTSIPSENISFLYYKVFAVDSSGLRSEESSEYPVNLQITNVNTSIKSYDLSLVQNYPNPFNPTTKIKFTVSSALATAQSVSTKLVLYNLLGQEVQTLLNKKLLPGNYEVEFDGSNLPSGIYLYKLTCGNNSLTKKMMLLK